MGTGVYNRMQFDRYFKNKIHNCTAGSSFSGILIDIDSFKLINDIYGHTTGDEALEITAELLTKSLRNKDDFLARYGGDEFIAILNIREFSHLRKIVERIHESVNIYNMTSNKPYKLSLSLGYDVYDSDSGVTGEQFIKHIDMLMYESKKLKGKKN